MEYADGMVTEMAKFWYLVNLQIKVAGAMVLTGALVTCLKTFKVFLGFDWLQAVNPVVNWYEQTLEVNEGSELLPMWELGIEAQTPQYQELSPEVFSEELFKDLPPQREWDHKIDLIEGSKALRGCCYPLLQGEMEALRDFLKTNIEAGKIRVSNSPYASLFFF
jgi:hypothetical protein